LKGGKPVGNILDSIIGFISPEAGARREAWRQNLNELRNYDAGNYDRLNAGWIAYNQSAENTDRYNRETVRARARDLERNSDMANSVIGAYKRNIVGLGVTLQADTPSEKLNDAIEEAWKEWCKKKNCDVTETQSFSQMTRMAVERKKVDGGILFRKCYLRGGVVPFRLQALEVDELDTTAMTPHSKGNRVVGGIEYNSYNKPMGYWIRQYSIDGFSNIDPVYVPAKDIIFIFTKRRPSQIREMSDLSPTITRIRDANEFMTAVSVKERIAACLSVFIKKTISTTGIGRGTTQQTGPRTSYEGKNISPGMIKELNAGDEIQVVNPTGQATDAASYVKLQQRLIGAGQGLSYEATSRDMSQSNYSSARQGIIEDEQTYIEDRELFDEFRDEVYETFIISGVLSGLFDIKDFWNPEKKSKYLAHKWVAAPKPWIDPSKEATATKIALQTGQKTLQQVAAENGRDWKDMIDDMAEVLEYGREKGIELGGIIYDRNTGELTPKDDDEPGENNPVPGSPGTEGEAPGEAAGGPGGQEAGAGGETPGNGQEAPGKAAGDATGGQEAGAKAKDGK
jgi:lambda family phage portal protein